MNATELYLKDGLTAGVWYCDKCKIVHRTKKHAEECCTPHACTECGQPCQNGWTVCQECRTKEHLREDAEKFKAATKVSQWQGWVYVEALGQNDGYFESLEELLDYCEEEGFPRPAYAWTCDANRLVNASMSDILARISDDGPEDFDPETLKGLTELHLAIKRFNEANQSVVYYTPNFHQALVIPPQDDLS